MRTTSVLTVLALATTFVAPLHNSASAQPTAYAASPSGYSVLSDQAKRSQELEVLAKFVPFAESFWRPSDLSEPRTGWYAATGAGVTQPRGAGDIAFVEATLLVAQPEQDSFGGVPRSTMIEHTIESIRHEALTNALSGTDYKRWGGGTWQASLETYPWAYAAHLLWSNLDADTQQLVQRVVTGEADILITKPIATAQPGNTGAEDNAWNTPTPTLAAVMFPDDPNRAAWEHTADKLAINASSTDADATSTNQVDGAPLSSWIASSNLHPDLTLENHGFFNPIYQQVTHVLIGDAAIFDAQAGKPLPEALSFRTQEIWDKVLGRLADDNGDIVMPAGQDWISKDYQHLDYLSILATRFRDPDASVLESRAVQLVAQRQATHANGSILGQPELGYESMIAKRLAGSWWNHTLFGPSPQPTQAQFETARAATSGVTTFPSVDVIAARLDGASAFMSWDSERPMGLWIPREEQHLDDPLLTYYAPGSLVGSATGTVSAHSCDCADDRFSTAGVIGGRDFSMTAFPDGTTLLLDRGTGSTFTYAMEQIPGVTGDRTIHSASGDVLGNLTGNWVNAANRVGMVVLGGSGINARDVQGTNNTRLITGSTATGTGNRGAVLYPDVDAQTTATLAQQIRQPAVPDGWSALAARAADATDRIAIARWSGPASPSISISDERGAPVPVETATLNGTTATFAPSLSAPASEGETARFFVNAAGSLVGRQDGENRAVLTNLGTAPVRATTTYVGPNGTDTVDRVIAAGETVTARVVNGQLSLAGGEYEHLLAACAVLSGLQQQIADWVSAGKISTSSAAKLSAAVRQILDLLTEADSADSGTDPATDTVAADTAAATKLLQQISPPADVTDSVAQAITSARQAAGSSLAQAQKYLGVALGLWLDGSAMPGEEASILVTMLNRGQAAATHATLATQLPAGWTMINQIHAFDALEPGQTARVRISPTVSPNAEPDATATIAATLSYSTMAHATDAQNTLDVTVEPLLMVTPTAASIPLAAGGWNRAQFTVHNNASHQLDVSLVVHVPDGVTAVQSPSPVSLAPGTDAAATVELTNKGPSTGIGQLTLAATTSTGVTITASQSLMYSDNLAFNPTTAPFPAAFADSNQTAFPPQLANDGDAATFWVSGGNPVPGNGPTQQHPIAVGIDLGHDLTIGSVTVVPRANYGPKSYLIQVSDDKQTWSTVGQVTNGPNAPLATQFSPVQARYLRLLITAGYDGQNRNVQLAELQIRDDQ